MINLTKQERLILIFLGFVALSGVTLNICFKNAPHLSSFYGNIIENKIFNSKLNINSADKEDLLKIKGIGPVLAQRIVDYRTSQGPFLSVDDIIYVKGIGEKKFRQINDFIKID